MRTGLVGPVKPSVSWQLTPCSNTTFGVKNLPGSACGHGVPNSLGEEPSALEGRDRGPAHSRPLVCAHLYSREVQQASPSGPGVKKSWVRIPPSRRDGSPCLPLLGGFA